MENKNTVIEAKIGNLNELTKVLSVCWNNFFSETEAVNIGKTMIDEDGVKGFHWGHDTFVSAVKQLGGIPEEKPYYNSYALCVTANMIYSDWHTASPKTWVTRLLPRCPTNAWRCPATERQWPT